MREHKMKKGDMKRGNVGEADAKAGEGWEEKRGRTAEISDKSLASGSHSNSGTMQTQRNEIKKEIISKVNRRFEDARGR